MSNSKESNVGIGFVGLLALLFIGLKLTGYIMWSWWWVCVGWCRVVSRWSVEVWCRWWVVVCGRWWVVVCDRRGSVSSLIRRLNSNFLTLIRRLN